MRTRVLCVDDDQDQCELLRAALSRMGFAPTTTTSPVDALDLVAKESFDVIVTDLEMEEMDGLSLCGWMVAARPGIPIIVLTGRGSLQTAVDAMRAGAYDFLTKPAEPALLLASVARAARRKQLILCLAARSVRAKRALQDSHTCDITARPEARAPGQAHREIDNQG